MTLTTLRGFIPAVFRSRYGDDFLIGVANEILADIEEECDPDYFRMESALLLKQYVQDYPLPDTARHIRGLYSVPCGWVTPDRDFCLPVQIIGSKFRIDTPFIFSANTDVTGTASTNAADNSSLTDTTAGKLDASVFSDNQLKSRLIKIVHGAGNGGQTEYRILIGNTVASENVAFNGDLDAPVKSGEAYTITDNFLILDHVRYLTRFTAITGVVPLSQDFEKLLRTGLTFKYHFQADEMSPEAQAWAKLYQAELDRFRIDTSKPRGMVPRNQAREMMPLYSGMVQ